MGSGIGTISIDFDAQIAKFVSSTNSAGKAIDNFAAKANANKSAGDHLFGTIAGAELFAHGLMEVGHAALEAGRKIAELVAQTVEADAKAFRLASTMGMSVGALQGLQSAAKIGAGVDPEAFTHGLEHMSAGLAKAATEGGEAKDAIERMGLSAKTLASQSPDKSFLQIAEALSKVNVASLRLKIADDIFGARQAKELLPLLSQGSEKIKAFADEARKSGSALSDLDAAKVTAAAQLEEKFNAVVQQLTVALSPALQGISKYVADLVPGAESMQSAFGTGIEYVATGLGYLMDAWKVLKVTVLTVATGVVIACEVMSFGVSKIIDGIVRAHNLVSDTKWAIPDITGQLDAVREGMWEETKKAADGPWPHQQVDAFFNHMKEASKSAADQLIADKPASGAIDNCYEAGKELKKLTGEFQKDIDTFGKSESEKKIYEFAQKFGEIPKHLQPGIDKIREMAKTLTDLEKQKKDIEEIRKMAEEGLTPFAKWTQEMEKMNRLLAAGKITQGEFDRAKKKAQEDYRKAEKKEDKGAAVMARRFDFHMVVNERNPELEVAKSELVEIRMTNTRLLAIQNSNDAMAKKTPQVADF